MISLSRYRYLPINHKDYVRKYIDSLKTGELLVDLTDHDIYVTEEGFNLPIPTTKALRDTIIEFLETDLEGIHLRKQVLPNKVNNLYNLKDQIEEQQYLTSSDLHTLEGHLPNPREKVSFINTINERNINQLGDLHINLDNLQGIDTQSRIQQLIFRFNELNNSSDSLIYDNNSTKHNTELSALWTELTALMNEAKGKLDSLGSFKGEVQLSRNQTSEQNVYDIQYSRRLYNWSNWWSITTEAEYIRRCTQLESYFLKWFKGQAYQDIKYNDMFGGGKGTGLFYKNFPNKQNINTGNNNATKYNAWDLAEGLPTTDYASKPFGRNYAYNFSTTNRAYPDLRGRGTYANSSNFTHRLSAPNSSRNSRFSWGSARWQTPYSQSGNDVYTNDAMLNRISTVNSNGLQRTPRSTKTNARSGMYSNQVPTTPTITRAVRYVSSANNRNADGLVVRLGVQKKIRVTTLDYKKYNFNNSTGWR